MLSTQTQRKFVPNAVMLGAAVAVFRAMSIKKALPELQDADRLLESTTNTLIDAMSDVTGITSARAVVLPFNERIKFVELNLKVLVPYLS
jgi:hypothetical protein